MSNALVVLNDVRELSPLQQAIVSEMEQEQNAFDYIPTRIKFPSGGTNAFSTNDGDIIKPPFVAIVAVSQKARAFWPNKDAQGAPPLCASPDGVQGIFDDSDQAKEQIKIALSLPVRHPALASLSDAKGPWPCAPCPLAQWGSGAGRGQSCKALRRLIVLVRGWAMPAIMTLPPTSVKVFDMYASACARKTGQAYFTTWTKFELEGATSKDTGIKYSVLKLSPDKTLEEGEIAAVLDVRAQYAALVRNLGIDASDYADSGEAPTANGRHVDADGVILEGESLPPF